MRARGFTLIEVLVALFIVAIAMSAVLGSMTSAADTAVHLRDRTFAQWVALNRIAEARLLPRLPRAGKTTGEVEFAGREWVWEQNVQPMQFEGTFRIDVNVRPKQAGAGGGAGKSWYATGIGMFGTDVERRQADPSELDMNKGFGTANPGNDQDQEDHESDDDESTPPQEEDHQ